MKRVILRKDHAVEVVTPTRTAPAGFDDHTHEILAGSTRTELAGGFDFDIGQSADEKEADQHSHAIRPGADRTEPGGFDDHTHALTVAKGRKAIREILDVDVFFLSLVDEGANDVEVMLKSAAGGKPLTRIESVAKLKEGLLYTLVYGPDIVDAHGDFASKQTVRNIAHKFIPNMVGTGIDIMHNCKPVDPEDAHLCETFIIQKNGDDRFKGVKVQGQVIEDTTQLEGWWATVMKLNSPTLRAPFENGDWTGVSLYGPALVRDVQKQKFTTALANRLGLNPQETDMDETKLAEALAKALSPLIEKVDALATPKADTSVNDTVVKDAEVIEFEGDPDSLEDIDAHEEKIFKASLDLNKPADLKKWRTFVEKKTKAAAEGESDELTKAKAEAKAATDRVQALSKASNQDTGDVKTNETDIEKVTRIRKSAKETAQAILRSQGRLPALTA